MLRGRRARNQAGLQAAGAPALAQIESALRQVPGAAGLDSLRGLEGAAARAYFGVFRATLRPELSFEQRTRRPPRDPANALLSLSYSLLTQAVFSACEVAGLDPYCGFFHADKYGRPALALDLVEEFRSVIADSVTLSAVNKQILKEKDFDYGPDAGESGVYLSRPGLKRFLALFSHRLQDKVHHPLAGRALTYQKVLEVQARQARSAIEQDKPETYRPFRAR